MKTSKFNGNRWKKLKTREADSEEWFFDRIEYGWSIEGED